MFKDWTKFEKAWMLISIMVITTLSIVWKDTLIGFIASITGIICVVLGAKGKLASYLFGAE